MKINDRIMVTRNLFPPIVNNNDNINSFLFCAMLINTIMESCNKQKSLITKLIKQSLVVRVGESYFYFHN